MRGRRALQQDAAALNPECMTVGLAWVERHGGHA
jgi:hypothetical protein